MRLDDPRREWNLNKDNLDLSWWPAREITLHQTSNGLLLLMRQNDATSIFPPSFSTRYNEDGAGNRPWWEPVDSDNIVAIQDLLAEGEPYLPDETYSEAELEAALSFAEI